MEDKGKITGTGTLTGLGDIIGDFLGRLFGAHVVPTSPWMDTTSPENHAAFLGHRVPGELDSLQVQVTFDDQILVRTKAADAFSSMQYPVGSTNAVQVAGRNYRRRTVMLRNGSERDIAYSESPNCTIGSAAFLGAGEAVEIDTTAPVYAIARAGDSNVLHVVQLFEIGGGTE